jgi:putative ABC transport system substrate-binding protein
MNRRAFIALLGGSAATAWPLAACAQQPGDAGDWVPQSHIASTQRNRLRGFRQGLKDTGHVEGENVAIEFADELPSSLLSPASRQSWRPYRC